MSSYIKAEWGTVRPFLLINRIFKSYTIQLQKESLNFYRIGQSICTKS